MAQNRVEKTIFLNGQLGVGFDKMVSGVLAFGNGLEQVGQKAKEFLGDSLDVYKDYESNMLAAKFALSAQYKDASELNKIMQQLGKSAAEWAETSIFHTSDVSEAINEAAHAGWDLEQIMAGIPKAMLISQAGGMELSEGLDYLIKMINSTGSEFEDAGSIVDQWAMAANSSATNIQELGDAFKALGASAQFGDSTAELFTMLAVLADVGTTGSQAGTALRSSIVRLIAPTEKANAAMKVLGLETDEIEEALSDQSVQKAAKKLQELGFSTYKADGELKPLVDIYSDLYETTKGLDEESRNEILAAIFPTRTISSALAFLEAADGKMQKLLGGISGSDGYAKTGAEMMMSGLEGSEELLASKFEELKRKVGEFTAPDLENFNKFLGGILDDINNWPKETWEAFVTGMETLAVGGTLVGATKGLYAFWHMLGPWGAGIMLTTFAVSSLVGYFQELDRLSWAEKFGSMELDTAALEEYMSGIHTKWEEEQELLKTYEESVSATLQSFEDASSKLEGSLFTSTITGRELTDDEKKNIKKYYNDLIQAVNDGITSAEALKTFEASFNLQLSGEKKGESEAGWFMMQLIGGYFDGIQAQADEAGKELGEILSQALADGIVDVDEQEAVDAGIQKMNEIENKIAEMTRESDFQAALFKAQHLSWDSVNDFITGKAAERDTHIKAIEDEYFSTLGQYKTMFNDALESGREIEVNGEKLTITSENYDELWDKYVQSWMDESLEAKIASEHGKYDEILMRALDTLVGGSELGEGWKWFKENLIGRNPETIDWEDMIRNGGLTEDAAKDIQELVSDERFMNLLKLTSTGGKEYLDFLSGDLFESGFFGSLYKNYEHYVNSGGTWDDFDIFSTREQRAAREAAMSEAQGVDQLRYKLEELLKTREDLNKEIELYKLGLKNGDTDSMGNPMYNEETLNQLISQRAEMDAQIDELEQKINGIDTTLEFEPDYEEVTKTPPPDLVGTVYYVAKFLGGRVPTLFGRPLFAEGGRATEASIFGETGPEWAIPEAHTERTADLLVASAQASGFTWSELLARNGGLNSGANGGTNVTIGSYAPVIHAGDASGVAQALADDKERLKRVIQDAIRESEMQRDMRKYA